MIYICIVAIIFIGDYFIKKFMERTLNEGKEESRLKGFILLRKHHNKGAFLNAGEKNRTLVAALSLMLTVVVLLIFIVTLGRKGTPLFKLGLSLLLGGAFSNTYDRIKRGYVVDYLSFGVKWKWLSNIIFNISDFAIIIGAMLTAFASGKVT